MNERTTQTWKLEELAQQTGVSARTIRYYVQRGLLPAPVFRGRDTVYSHEHLLKLKAIRRLQERFLSLDAIQHQLAHASPEALSSLLAEQDETNALLPLLPWPAPGTRAVPPVPGERWQRWQLAPGLELHLADSADAVTRRQAEALLNAFRQQHHRGEPS